MFTLLGFRKSTDLKFGIFGNSAALLETKIDSGVQCKEGFWQW